MAERYIAVRRPRRRSARLPRDAKRRELSEQRAQLVQGAAALSDVGLEQVASVAQFPRDPDEGAYTALDGINALVCEPAEGTSIDTLRDQLDDFVVIGDIQLSLPHAAAGHEVAESDLGGRAPLPACSGVQAAHAAGNRGDQAVIAVLDTGCDAGHPEFAGRVVDFAMVPPDENQTIAPAFGFDLGRHGTHVAAIAAGNSLGIAPGASLIAVSVMESDTMKTTAVRLYRALGWLASRADEPQYADRAVILNLSLGFRAADIAAEELDTTLQAIRITLEDLVALDILPVVAIGNEGPGTFRAPGFYPESLSAGAVDFQGIAWPGSGGGTGAPGFEGDVNPDLVGYGVDVVSAFPRNLDGSPRYWSLSGTSMAAPYVAGIAALVATATGREGAALRDALLQTAMPLTEVRDRVGRGLARYAPEAIA